MPRLIDADKLRKDVLDLPNCYNGFSDAYDKAMIIDLVDEQPTVDAERHGRWIDHKYKEYPIGRYECSVCGAKHDMEWDYCPNCGAKMDESCN